ncbi:MAG: LacI family DNA-binding transcriptional regulator [Sphingomonadales bacterium]|nr:LacI family DNA-binding transcriptional regulator [Sphingomonadales bacterium]MDE2170560.1 LacI family DNA-binding transcriptional regulator [Sphingomonadales bacterium]
MRSSRRSRQSVTIQSVADAAGVSPMTVSHVINSTKAVRDTTRAAVMKAVEELGYVPNAAARSLASARSTRIGIVYRNAHNAFLSAMLVGALNAAARAGVQIILRQCDDLSAAAAQEAVSALVRSGANAILLAPPYSEMISGTSAMAGLDAPMAAIACGRALVDMDTVGVDEKAAAMAMTRHLLDRGYRRIGFVMGASIHSGSKMRFEGYGAALAENGLAIDPTLIAMGDFSFESGLAAGATLLDLPEPPDAIFASNDDMAAGVILSAHRRGLRIPQDVAVAGFDDAPIAVKIWPPLTTVRQDIDLMATRATDWLIARHRDNGQLGEAPMAEWLPHRIVLRESA